MPPADPKALARQALATRAVARYALDLLNTQAVADADGVTAATDFMTARMLDNVTDFRCVEAGRITALSALTDWRRDDFMRRLKVMLERTAEQSPLPVSLDEALIQADTAWAARRDTDAALFAHAAIDAVYQPARERAVERLRVSLASGLEYPSPAELDPLLLALDKRRDKGIEPLAASAFKELELRIPGTPSADPVFEELDGFVADLDLAMQEEIHRQYRRQTAVVGDYALHGLLPAELLTRDELRDFMDARLDEQITASPNTRPPVYPVFAAVRAWIADAAAYWEARRFANFVENNRTDWAPSADDLTGLIMTNISAHVNPGRSTRVLVGVWAENARQTVSAGYVRQAPAQARSALDARLGEGLTAGGDLERVWHECVRRTVMEILPGARESIAEAQLSRYFPGLMESRDLSEPVIVFLHDRGIRDVSDIATLLESLAQDPALASADGEPGQLLDETQARALEVFNARAGAALEALAGQLSVVRELESDWMDKLRADVAAGVGVDRMLNTWTREWERRWGARAGAVQSAWRKPFARTRDQLDKTVRQLYSSVETAQVARLESVSGPAADQSAADSPASADMKRIDEPARTPGETAEPVEDEMEDDGEGDKADQGIREELSRYRGDADGVLLFTDLPDGRSRLVFGAPDGRGALEVEFDPADVASSAEHIVRVLREPLRQVLDGAPAGPRRGFLFFTRARASELRMLFRVDSPSLRHQMSIMVRGLIDDEIRRWSEATGRPLPVLQWQEEVGVKK